MYQFGLRYKLFPDADRKHPIFNRFQPAGWPYPVCIFLSQDIALSLTCSYRFHCQVSPSSKRGGQMTTNFPPICLASWLSSSSSPFELIGAIQKVGNIFASFNCQNFGLWPEAGRVLGSCTSSFFSPSLVHIFILHMLKFHEVRRL